MIAVAYEPYPLGPRCRVRRIVASSASASVTTRASAWERVFHATRRAADGLLRADAVVISSDRAVAGRYGGRSLVAGTAPFSLTRNRHAGRRNMQFARDADRSHHGR